MRFASARFVNFGPHEELDVKFGDMTCVIGPNGSGKSTVVGGLQALLSGKFPALHGTKASHIRKGTDSRAKAYVSGELTLPGGVAVSVTRSLPDGHRLEVAGEVLVRKSDIEPMIHGWLGMDPETFVDLAFAPQWSLRELVDAQSSKRAESLHRLFGLDRAERCYDAIGDRLAKLRLPTTLVDLVEAKRRIVEFEARLRECQRLRAGLGTADVTVRDTLYKQIAHEERRLVLIKKLNDLAAAQILAYTKNEEQRLALAAAEETWGRLHLQTAPERESQIHSLLNAHQDWLRKDKLYRAAAAELKAASGVPEPAPPPAVNAMTEEDHQQLTNLKAEFQRLGAFIGTFDPATGIAACPVCETPTDRLANKLLETADRYGVVDGLVCALNAKAEATRQHQLALAHFERLKTARASKINAAQAKLAALTVEEAPVAAEEVEKLSFEVAALASTRLEAEAAQRKLLRTRGEASAAAARLEAANVTVMSCQDEINKLGGEDFNVVAARVQLREFEAADTRRFALDAELSVLSKNTEQLRKDVAAAEVAAGQTEKLEAWRSRLEKARQAFHRDSLPKIVAEAHMETLEGEVNSELELLGADFRVHLGSGLAFEVDRGDGQLLPATWLSGGQKVVLALAWRLAVNSAFAKDVGLICLDEPTAGLDAERLRCFRQALERLRQQAAPGGLQVVVVTHERSLIPLFDTVVELA